MVGLGVRGLLLLLPLIMEEESYTTPLALVVLLFFFFLSPRRARPKYACTFVPFGYCVTFKCLFVLARTVRGGVVLNGLQRCDTAPGVG